MKKLLFVIDQLTGGGAERALVNLVRHLDPTRFHSTILTVWPGGEDRLSSDVCVRCLNPRGSWAVFLLLRLLAQLKLFHPFWVGKGYDLEIAYLEAFPTKLLSASPGPKLAWVHCDMTHKRHREKMARWYPGFDRVVCVSKDVEKAFLRYFFGRTVVLPNIIDRLEILEKSREFPAESFDILALGRLSPEKGFDRLIAACEELQREGLSFRVGILGTGPEEENLRKQAEDLKNITFLGYRENPYPYLRAAKILAIPSRSEGASTVAAEGLILGKAILAAPCSGMGEILEDSALITGDLTAGLRRLLTDGDFRASLAEKAARRGTDFDPRQAAERTEALFLQVLAERGRL